jgi:hypothetical protein
MRGSSLLPKGILYQKFDPFHALIRSRTPQKSIWRLVTRLLDLGLDPGPARRRAPVPGRRSECWRRRRGSASPAIGGRSAQSGLPSGSPGSSAMRRRSASLAVHSGGGRGRAAAACSSGTCSATRQARSSSVRSPPRLGMLTSGKPRRKASWPSCARCSSQSAATPPSRARSPIAALVR